MKDLTFLLVFATAAFAAHPAEEFTTGVDTYNGSVVSGTFRITPIQHAGLMLQATGQVVYVDPAQGNFDGLPPEDVILIIHIHPDRFVPKIIEKLRLAKTIILAPEVVAISLPGVTVLHYCESEIIQTSVLGEWIFIPMNPPYTSFANRRQMSFGLFIPKLFIRITTVGADPKAVRVGSERFRYRGTTSRLVRIVQETK